MNISMIVACDNNNNIGKNGKLPWRHLKEDMALFKKMTSAGKTPAVVMGRKTWESIHKPLPGRVNIVISNTINNIDGAIVATSADNAVRLAKLAGVDNLWVIGGEKVYNDFMGTATTVYVTRINSTFDDCDAVFPFEYLKSCYQISKVIPYSTSSYEFTLETWITLKY